MTILHYDCFSGISGDMNLGAMIDLGIDPDWLRAELGKLNLKGWELDVVHDQRHGIKGTKVTVRQTVHEHVHRDLSDITKIIDQSLLEGKIKDLAKRIFTVIAEAEAHVHGIPVNRVQFHEVGAIDAIVDIVGAAICFNHFSPDAVVITPVELGGGFVKCAHGTLPVPAPATIEIVRNLKVRYNGVNFEATTPTGAAILAVLAENTIPDGQPVTISKTGYGVGHKEHPDVPNLLRVSIGETGEYNLPGHEATLLECNIDDMNPELYEHISEILFTRGASDVFLTEIIMKKGRPGIILSVICEKGLEETIREIIFTETTTIGIRTSRFMKSTLTRKTVKVTTEYGEVDFKYSFLGKRLVTAKPESDQCRIIAAKNGLPLKEVIARLSRYTFDQDITQ